MKKFLAAILFAVLALPAQAGVVQLQVDSFTFDPPATVNFNGVDYQAGQFTGTIDGAAFYAWCVELGQTFQFGQPYTYNSAPIAFLSSTFEAIGDYVKNGGVTDALTSAAVQYDIWNAIYGNALVGTYGVPGQVQVWYLQNDQHQDFVMFTPRNGEVPVHEPAGLALLGLGMIGLSRFRKH
jgi:hypothetical protein